MDKFDTSGIIGRIQDLINSMSTNPTAFAKSVGIDPSNFSRKLKSEQPITEKDIAKICANAHVSKDWLVNGTGEKDAPQPNGDAIWFLKDRIIELARQLAENKENIARLERENNDITSQLSTLCSQLDKMLE